MSTSVAQNPRGIPSATFIDDVSKVENIETSLGEHQELHSKYKFMESRLVHNRDVLRAKIPDIVKALEMVNLLESKKGSGEAIRTKYELADTIHATAKVENVEKVCLWLGANVMVEYTIEEALELLKKNLATATKNEENTTEDINFLRDQVVTTEVNLARLYNWEVKQRLAKKDTEQKEL